MERSRMMSGDWLSGPGAPAGGAAHEKTANENARLDQVITACPDFEGIPSTFPRFTSL
ncbi:MAG: hypothetical protein KGJ41_07900 [Rhodospirillales bacterium]|nr:hypothetical protein [Rhodospirillales bacterium]